MKGGGTPQKRGGSRRLILFRGKVSFSLRGKHTCPLLRISREVRGKDLFPVIGRKRKLPSQEKKYVSAPSRVAGGSRKK